IFDLAIPGLGRLGSAVLSGVISGYWIIVHHRKINLDSSSININVLTVSKDLIFVYALFFIVVCLRIFFDSDAEISFFFSSAKSTLILVATLLYVKAFLQKDTGLHILNIFTFNALICFVAGSFPSFLNYIYIFKLGDPEPGFIPYRNAFLAGSGYYGIGAPYAIVFLFSVIYIISSNRYAWTNYIRMMLIAVAGVLAARTVFVGIIFGALYALYKKPKVLLIGTLLIGIGFFVLLSFGQTSQFSDWIFEIFITDSASVTGSKSTDDLVSMYFIPNLSTIFFGDGKYIAGDNYYMNTDGGYMRHLLFGGIPITILALAIPLVISKISKSRIFGFFIVPLMYVLHVKGGFIYNSPSGMPLIILIAFWMRYFMPTDLRKKN
ncbi:hypothetical protein QN379_20325, partial [Glaciimonas sp. Gout2]